MWIGMGSEYNYGLLDAMCETLEPFIIWDKKPLDIIFDAYCRVIQDRYLFYALQLLKSTFDKALINPSYVMSSKTILLGL